jgi:hypothetical protein
MRRNEHYLCLGHEHDRIRDPGMVCVDRNGKFYVSELFDERVSVFVL